MEQVLTVVCKLQVPPAIAAELVAALAAFAQACDFINQAVPAAVINPRRMQALLYQGVWQRFGLSANLAIRAMGRVAANRKAALAKGKAVRKFLPTSLDYDARLFSLREKDWSVSLRLLHSRRRLALVFGAYQRRLLQGRQPTSATLVRRCNGQFYLHIQVKSQVPEPLETKEVLGIDLGRTDIVHTSQGEHYSSQDIKQVRDRFARVRASSQHTATKGTRSSRRRCRQLQQRLSGRERRFQAWLNHTISYRLVRQAKEQHLTLALEDLSGIRERANQQPRNRTERRRANSRAFYQLRQFIAYKAAKGGVPVVLVDPAYTSRTCHQWLHFGERVGKAFSCGHCGYQGAADYNGANMIARLGLLVNQPHGPGLFCVLPDSFRALESPLQTA